MLRLFSMLLVALVIGGGALNAQDDGDTNNESTYTDADETPAEERTSIDEIDETVKGLGERASTLESEIEKLKSVRITGYVQGEWQHFDQNTSSGGRALFSDARKNFFTIRRGRIKFEHRLGSLMKYVIQPDITERSVEIKDAFITLNLVQPDELTLDIGMFNRPNYEVELSSGTRESAERSQVVRAFYPGERDLGIMFTWRRELFDRFEPRVQLGLFNGPGAPRSETDAYKDFIGRVTFPIPIGGDSPVQVDLGASVYYGGIPQRDSAIRRTENGETRLVPNDALGSMPGFGNNSNVNIEGQIFLDVFPFGGTILKGEFLNGSRATAGTAATPSTVGIGRDSTGREVVRVVPGSAATPVQIRNQTGFYLYFVQNFGTWMQIVAKYDVFDRNTDMSGTQVRSATDAASSVIGIGANFFHENLRVTLWYEIPRFAADENIQIASGQPVEALRGTDLKDNKTTVRFQYRF